MVAAGSVLKLTLKNASHIRVYSVAKIFCASVINQVISNISLYDICCHLPDFPLHVEAYSLGGIEYPAGDIL